MAERWKVKFWRMYEPAQHTDYFPSQEAADAFADGKQDDGYLCIVRQDDTTEDLETTLPRKVVRLFADAFKEKFDAE
jgi:hypothetical protein